VRADWRKRAEHFRELCDDPHELVALVFGSEADGLDTPEVEACKEVAYLPTAEEHQSINLASAVAVVLFTLFSGRAVHKARARATPRRANVNSPSCAST
jgi:tRNA C32,U32 (ribose-2'-O)-methylase TrmJ